MKGVLKIKSLKKYITIVFTAFAFLFININDVNAQSLNIDNSLFSFNDIQTTNTTTLNFNKNLNYKHIMFITDRKLLDNEKIGAHLNYSGNYSPIIINNNNFLYEFEDKYYYLLDKSISNGLSIKIPLFDSGTYNTVLHSDLTINEIHFLSKRIIPIITNLNYELNNDVITFNYNLPIDDNFSHLELYQDGLLLADNITTNIFEVFNLEYDTKYNFTFYSVDKNGSKSTGISREIALPSDPNLIPSNNIFGLTHSVSDTTVSFNYSLPLDNNFSHLKIYRNNELINDNYQLAEFIDTGLEPETEYNYRFVSVNKMDISNVGYAVTIKTMEENDDVPPAIPTGLNTTNMNSGIVLSWNTNNETDLQGYYVYMNGVKMNSKAITNTIYNITNLENGTKYNFTVSAVDTFGNESEQSSSVVGVPDVDKLPIFKLDTQLSSIGSSVENWFSEIWLIVAFATAIPLSFAIAGRVKGLFIA